MNKRLKKSDKGITLIALVITIIVLLILAGISIAMLTGENGILTKATSSREENEKAQALEELKLKVLQVETDKQGTATLQDVVDSLNDDEENEYMLSTELASITGTIPDVSNISELYIKYKNYWFKIDKNLNVEYSSKEDETTSSEYDFSNYDGINIITLTGKQITESTFQISIDTQIDYAKYNYYIRKKDSESYNKYTSTSKNYIFNNIERSTKYQIYIEALDNNNNILETTDVLNIDSYNSTQKIKYPEDGIASANAVVSYYNQYAEAAFDNNDGTAWCNADASSVTGWIQYDFGKETNISGFSIQCRNDGFHNQVPKDFTLYGSHNGTDYEEIQHFSEAYTTSSAFVKEYSLSNTDTNYRYYKFDITSTQGGSNIGIAELKFYTQSFSENNSETYSLTYCCYTMDAIEYPEDGTASANAVVSYHKQYAEAAFDNNDGTAWCNADASSVTGWIQYDFGKETTISGFSIQCRNDGFHNQVPKDFTLYGSHNGTDYEEIQHFSEAYTTSSAFVKEYYLSNANTNYRYYKFDITSTQGGNNIGIAELKFLKIQSKYNKNN